MADAPRPPWWDYAGRRRWREERVMRELLAAAEARRETMDRLLGPGGIYALAADIATGSPGLTVQDAVRALVSEALTTRQRLNEIEGVSD